MSFNTQELKKYLKFFFLVCHESAEHTIQLVTKMLGFPLGKEFYIFWPKDNEGIMLVDPQDYTSYDTPGSLAGGRSVCYGDSKIT